MVCDTLLGEPEIREQSMALVIQDDIFRFQVSVDNIHSMEMLKSEQYFSNIDLGFLLLYSVKNW